MALEYTIKAIQDAFAGSDRDLKDEARTILNDPDARRMILSNHGIDPTEMDDDTVLSTLLEHSQDEV